MINRRDKLQNESRILSLHLDLVAWRLVSLPAGSGLSSAVTPHHILVQLFRDVQVCHSNQVTAMLQKKEELQTK